MPIDFSPQRWQQVKQAYRDFWSGDLPRPIVPIELIGRDPGRPEPKTPLLTMAHVHELDVPAEDVIDRMDWELSRRTFLGDAYPRMTFAEYGPGLMAAFIGGILDNSTGLVWFHPARDLPIQELHFEYTEDNPWFQRVKQLCVAGMERWQGQVMISVPDLGGNLDILSTFRPADKLLLDLIDHPEEVNRVVWEIHEIWHRYYREFNKILQPQNQGFGSWAYLFSEKTFYMLQCDVAYMIGPGMFEEFVNPELVASCQKLDHPFYHLDGVGQLVHLDSLLGIEPLKGIQWVPGAGKPSAGNWPDVFQRIHAAGKLIQITMGDLNDLEMVIQQVGTGAGISYQGQYQFPIEREFEIRQHLSSLLCNAESVSGSS